MKIRLLKKLRREIRRNLYVFKNESLFTLNHAYLKTWLKGVEYRTEEYWGTINMKVMINLYIELECLALKGYIDASKRNT